MLDGSQGRTNPFAAASGDKIGDAAFLQNYLTTCYVFMYLLKTAVVEIKNYCML